MVILLIVLLTLSAFPAAAQNLTNDTQNNAEAIEPVFFFSPVFDVAFYSEEGPSAGIGITIGADGRVAMGLSCLYFFDISSSSISGDTKIFALEFMVLLRVYFKKTCIGPFIQFNGGQVMLFDRSDASIPAVTGTSSIGLSLGWRIPMNNFIYIEPIVRGGYPFIAGGGISLGFRF